MRHQPNGAELDATAGTSALALRQAPAGHGPPSLAVVGSSRSPAPEVYRRRRLVVLAAVVASLVALVSLAQPALAAFVGGEAEALGPSVERLEPGAVYVVEPGDTLWSIARALEPEGDPRPVVDRLEELTGGPVLQVGQEVPLPGG